MEHWHKYPRTFHAPWSQGATSDDKIVKSMDHFTGMEVVVTEKMDGENTTMYRDHFHARSLDSKHHDSRDNVKALWGVVKYDIPEGWRVCGENLYARHALSYTKLPAYFQAFSVWDDNNMCLSWDDTVEWFTLLAIKHVPVLYRGVYDEKIIKALWDESKRDVMEGYVIRNANSFHYDDFAMNVAKFVRKGHVDEGSDHWSTNWVPNGTI